MNDIPTEELIALRDKASSAYYGDGDTIMDDAEFDALTDELRTRGVEDEIGHGYAPAGKKVSRTVRMASLRKSHDGDGALDSLLMYSEEHGLQVIAQAKCDGLPVSLKYDDGILVEASTRGDGFVGEDVTKQARLIAGGDLANIGDANFNFEVRGEVLFPVSSYHTLKERGYTKPRNSAVGALRKGNPSDLNDLTVVIWDVIDDQGDTVLDAVNATVNGLPVPDALVGFLVPTKEIDIAEGADPDADIVEVSGDFANDGIVYKIASPKGRREMGEGATSPNWAIAHKFEDVPVMTTVLGVTWQSNRVKITPVAELEPVEIDGSMVSRASLHNVTLLEEMGLRIGDTVAVRLANKIIPQVVGIVSHSEDGTEWVYPEMEYRREGRELVPVVVDAETRISGAINRLGILNVGPALVRDFVSVYGEDSDFIDLWLASDEDIVALGSGYGMGRAIRTVNSMHANDGEFTQGQVLGSFLIDGVGSTRARRIIDDSDGYGTIAALVSAVEDDEEAAIATLSELVGPSVANSVVNQIEMIKSLDERYTEAGFVGVDVHDFEDEDDQDPVESPVTGLRVLVSGTLPSLKRSEAHSWIESHGGILASGVSKNTDLCVFGDKASSGKVKKAESLGIRIVDGATFESWVSED